MPGGLWGLIGAHKVAATVTAAVLVAGAGAAVGSEPGERAATVVKIVDGDTIDVRYDGGVHRVRLLNIDTPESVKPDEPVQCLGPEATDFLERLLPLGTAVSLRYDAERVDRFDRELAGVFLGETLINAEIAREGLGVAITVGGNTRFYEPVRRAQDEARAAGRGLFSSAVRCTVPGELAAVEAAAAAAATEPIVHDALDRRAAEIRSLEDQLVHVRELLDGDGGGHLVAGLTREDRTALGVRVAAARASLDASSRRLRAERNRVEQERRAVERAEQEAAALARAQEAEREAAAQRERERAAEERRNEARRQPRSSSNGAGSSSGGGYTGCRAYGQGGSIDEKGRRYKKIPCP